MTAGRLKSLNCDGCGAAFEADELEGHFVVCRFCGQSHTLQADPAHMPPADIPIPPPPPLPMMTVPTPKGSASGVMIGVALAVLVLVGVVSAVMRASSSGGSSHASSSSPSGGETYTPDAEYDQGEAVRVLWKGVWYDGHIKAVHGTKYLIGYDGWSSSWDEEVDLTRLRKTGDAATEKKKSGKKKGKRKKKD